MLKGIKNRKQAISLIFYILTKKEIVTLEKGYTREDILKYWEKKGEKGKEIFRDPRILENRLAGDCDDLANLLISTDKDKTFYLAYPVTKNAILHTYYMDRKFFIYDKWKSKKKFKIDMKFLNKYYNCDSTILIKFDIDEKNINITEMRI